MKAAAANTAAVKTAVVKTAAVKATGSRADLVVVGAGVAGLTAAVRAAESGLRVVVVNKGPAWSPDRSEQSTSTFYAQGGISVMTADDPVDPGDPGDSVDLHLADTERAGGGLTDAAGARSILADGAAAVGTLMGWGARFDRGADGLLSRTREGGHSLRRIIHAGGDATGAQIATTLGARVQAMLADPDTDLSCLDDTYVDEVLVVDGRVCGVVVQSVGEVGAAVVYAPTVLLATGGAGHLYAATTNPAGATADGIALALRAGARVCDLEFIQFHPTMLHVGGARGRRTLVSEAVRGEGGRLVDIDGRSVTAGVHPLGDLAPRDVVADAVQSAIERTGADHVYLDVRGVDDFAGRFPTVTAGVQAAGIDPGRGLIPVVPGAHYLCGGVECDDFGRTAVDGLLVAGEVARTGLHGANRLASNSLLEGLVTGCRAAVVALARRDCPIVEISPAFDAIGRAWAAEAVDRSLLQDVMTTHVGLRRDADGLAMAAAVVSATGDRDPAVPAGSQSGTPGSEGGAADFEDAALTLAAGAVIAAAAARTESRGCHVRTDHRRTDDHATSTSFALVDGLLVPAGELVSGVVMSA